MRKPPRPEEPEDRKAGKTRSASATRPAAPPPGPPARRPGGPSGFHVFKPGQGAYVRWGSAAAAAIVVLGLADFVYDHLAWFSDWVRYLVPVVLLAGLGYFVFRLVGQSRSTVDFMILTEGEMKKVNWSTRREVFGATRVVIVTVLALASILFAVNLLFIFLFESMKVLRIGMLERLFGSGTQ